MSLVAIPTMIDGTTSYSQRVRLENVDWLFDFIFNPRRDRWCLSISSLDGVGVVTGQPVVCGLSLLGRAVGGPPGQLVAFSQDGSFLAPGLRELGDRCRLIYITSEDELLNP